MDCFVVSGIAWGAVGVVSFPASGALHAAASMLRAAAAAVDKALVSGKFKLAFSRL